MKKVLVFLATVGLASASSLTLNSIMTLADSDLNSIPAGAVAIPAFGVPATGGPHGGGGLCVGAFAGCASNGPVTAGDVLTFTLSQASVLNIMLQDDFAAADVYEVLLSNNSTGTNVIQEFTSSIVSFNNSTVAQPCFHGSAPFATTPGDSSNLNSCLTATSTALAAGNYSITVWDTTLSYIGSQDPYGPAGAGGAIPNPGGEDNGQAGSSPTSWSPATFQLLVNSSSVAIPEPSTFALLGLGGIVLGLIRRRRIAQ